MYEGTMSERAAITTTRHLKIRLKIETTTTTDGKRGDKEEGEEENRR